MCHLTGYVIFECQGVKQEARPMLSQRSRATLSNYPIISDFNTLGHTFSSSILYKVYTVNFFIHEIYSIKHCPHSKEEARLSQRDRATLRVIDSRSLKVIESKGLLSRAYKSLLVKSLKICLYIVPFMIIY